MLNPDNFTWIDRWEDEGGRVYESLDDDWEPSESETFTTGNVPMNALLYSKKETEYKLTCLLADATRHVRKFFLNRSEVAVQPTNAQQVGEFVTEIRRQLRSEYTGFAGIGPLTDVDAWANVAVPSKANDYKWRFSYTTTEGSYFMSLPTIQTICENALKMADTDKTADEEFREINNSLNNLMRETTALDSLIYKARDLNGQAAVVVDNLCAIAEKLNQE